MNIQKLMTGSAIGMGSVLATAVAVFAATMVVMPSDLAVPASPTATQQSWYFYNDNTNTASATELPGSYEFVTGIGNPPSGNGSVKFTVPARGRWNIATNQFAGTDLTDLGNLQFTIYRPSSSAGSTDTTLFFNFDVDFNNTTTTGYQGRLVYVPDDNGAITENTWETWDMDSGMWRWSRYGTANQWPDRDTDELRSWSEILTAFPNAEVLFETFTGQVLVRAGHPGPVGLVGYLDSVTIAGDTYDFEPAITPGSDKNACKKDGWKTFTNPTFKNQGQCVSYIQSNDKAGKRN